VKPDNREMTDPELKEFWRELLFGWPIFCQSPRMPVVYCHDWTHPGGWFSYVVLPHDETPRNASGDLDK
jgi:hypothetical protein